MKKLPMPQSKNIFENAVFVDRFLLEKEDPNKHHQLILWPATQRMLPDLNNSTVLDLGCGNGEFCRYATSNGAKKVVGIDSSLAMLMHSNTSTQDDCELIHEDLENIILDTETYDVIFSSMAIHYIENYRALFDQIYAALKDGGILVFSVEHPFYTSPEGGWKRAKSGERTRAIKHMYSLEGTRELKWHGYQGIKFHRKMESYLSALISNNFQIEALLEPTASPEILLKNPLLGYENVTPPYLLIRAKKK